MYNIWIENSKILQSVSIKASNNYGAGESKISKLADEITSTDKDFNHYAKNNTNERQR